MTTVTVAINTARATATAATNGMACVNFDWWPKSKCDYGRCPWQDAGVLDIDLEHPALVTAVQTLSSASPPLTIRVGGSLCDTISYNMSAADEHLCGKFKLDNSTHLGYSLKGPCMNMKRWEQLNTLCAPPNCRIAFGLNGLAGRSFASTCPAGTNCKWTNPPPKCCTTFQGDWDPSNALSLMRHAKRTGTTPFAFELGNEIAGPKGIEAKTLTAAQYGSDADRLAAAITSVWSTTASRPKVIAYDTSYDDAFVRALLNATDSIDILTTHAYVLGAGAHPDAVFQHAMSAKALDAQDEEYRKTAAAIASVRGAAARRPVPWVGEAGGAYNSGAPSVTDAFVSAFWYLDALGASATHGFGGWCRQTLVGGNYSLLSTDSFTPHPDFYAALLWRSLMGPAALAAGNASSQALRVYAHCAATGGPPPPQLANGDQASSSGGGVSVLLLNMGATALTAEVGDDTSPSWLSSLAREEWVGEASAAGMRASTVLINGVEPDGMALPPARHADAGTPITLPPMSYAFVRAIDAKALACM